MIHKRGFTKPVPFPGSSLGCEIDYGLVAVLHTWGQNLHHHPHVHCLVPGGGPRSTARAGLPAGAASSCRTGAVPSLPAVVPGASPRGLRRLVLLRQARRSHRSHRLRGSPCRPASPRMGGLRQAPFAGPEQMLAYLGRYTHRVAIANSRLVALADGRVSFR